MSSEFPLANINNISIRSSADSITPFENSADNKPSTSRPESRLSTISRSSNNTPIVRINLSLALKEAAVPKLNPQVSEVILAVVSSNNQSKEASNKKTLKSVEILRHKKNASQEAILKPFSPLKRVKKFSIISKVKAKRNLENMNRKSSEILLEKKPSVNYSKSDITYVANLRNSLNFIPSKSKGDEYRSLSPFQIRLKINGSAVEVSNQNESES